MSGVDAEAVAARLVRVRERIDAVARGRSVEVLAVTKGFDVDAVEIALSLGLGAAGENYAQELLAKHDELTGAGRAEPRWHFLGRLQRNKVRQLAPVVALWESVDRAELATEIARRAPGARVLVQANLSGEPQKGGAPLAEVPDLVERARDDGLVVVGLMGVGPAGPPEAARTGFRSLVRTADRLGLPVRSIGMSDDLEVAVQEGATEVRVGRDLFGERPARGAGRG